MSDDFPLDMNHKVLMWKTMESHLENLSMNFQQYFFMKKIKYIFTETGL